MKVIGVSNGCHVLPSSNDAEYSAENIPLSHSDKKYERKFDRIRYLIMLKSNIWDVYWYKYTKIKSNSGDYLPL